MAERIVVFCRTCNALIEASNQSLGRAHIAAWLTNHQGHDTERTNTTYTPTIDAMGTACRLGYEEHDGARYCHEHGGFLEPGALGGRCDRATDIARGATR